MPMYHVTDDVALVLRPGSDLEALSRRSRAVLLARLAGAIQAAQADASAFADWLESAVDRSDPDAREDGDDLFVAYRQFEAGLGVPAADRLPYAAFGRELSAARIAPARDEHGRIWRRGCRLRPVLIDLRPDWEGCDLDRFLAWAADAWGPAVPDRAGSRALCSLYAQWARDNAAQPLPAKRFARAMERAGFSRVRANGIWWAGLRLRAEHRQVHEKPPRPLRGGNAESKAEARLPLGDGVQ